MGNEVSSQATLAIITAFGLQWLKSRPWFPLLNFNTDRLNQAVSTAVAIVSSVGILATFEHGVLTISGLTAANVYHIVSRAVEQYAMQHATYKMAIAPPLPGVMQDADRKAPPAVAEEKKP